ncbi:MAG: hypothetical protein WKG01_35305 [Kofleriaceae bacterium]
MKILFIICAMCVIACGGKSGSGTDGGGDDGGGGDGGGDGGGVTFDAQIPAGCTAPIPGNPQCSNCKDDDDDGEIDGFDIHCTGPTDDDEASFKTGLPGDNVDPKNQDCFFDGDSGDGNDGCNVHICCILGVTDATMCPYPGNYQPSACPPPVGTTPLPTKCKEVCGNATPPGCDCFGCCTLCNDAGQCFDIALSASPNCTEDVLGDPTKCVPCTQIPSCGPTNCGGDTCILCPGQDPNDLPDTCTPTCPADVPSCLNQDCPDTLFCSNGCCIKVVQ